MYTSNFKKDLKKNRGSFHRGGSQPDVFDLHRRLTGLDTKPHISCILFDLMRATEL